VVWYGPQSTSQTASASNKPVVTADIVQGAGGTTTTIGSITTTPTTGEPPTGSTPPTTVAPFLSVGPSATPAPAASSTTTTSAPAPRRRPLSLVSRVKRAPPLSFYLAVLGILALLASFGFALGPAGEPVSPRRGGVTRVLDQRAAQRPASKEEA